MDDGFTSLLIKDGTTPNQMNMTKKFKGTQIIYDNDIHESSDNSGEANKLMRKNTFDDDLNQSDVVEN